MKAVLLAGVLVVFAGSGGEATYEETVQSLLQWGEAVAVGGGGWLVGLSGWLLTAHHGSIFLALRTPRAWRLGRQGILTSQWPLFKYLFGGVFLLVLAGGLGSFAFRLSPGPFRIGVEIGGASGLIWTARTLWEGGSQMGFLLSNRRYLHERAEDVLSDD